MNNMLCQRVRESSSFRVNQCAIVDYAVANLDHALLEDRRDQPLYRSACVAGEDPKSVFVSRRLADPA
ncbi:MAG: hypothetical protein WBA72_06265 [Ornithinimicrobium sp.]